MLFRSCETCIKAKSHRSTYLANDNKKLALFDLIHTDVWGPSPIMSKSGYRWYLSLTDDCSRMTWLYLLKTKAEVKKVFKDFITMVKTQFETNIKVIRSDNGTEFVNQELQLFFKENGILHETSCVGTPQQNGVAERKNRHILEISRALLIESNVPKYFWDSAVLFAVYLMNRTPTRVNDFKTPLQVFSEHMKLKSVLNLIPKIFGCIVYVHLQKEFRSKLDSRAEKCVFLGVGQNQKGFKCYNPITQKFYISMDVTFLEHEYFYKSINIPIQGENQHDLNCNFLTYMDVISQNVSPNSAPGGVTDSAQGNNNADPFLSEIIMPRNSASINEDLEMTVALENPDLHSEEVIQSEEVPHRPESLEDNPKVSSLETRFKLPPRCNRGQPPKRYVPENGTSEERYPIAKYTTTTSLTEPLKGFVNQISSITIPEKLEEARNDPKWVNAMNVEMDALEKNETWEITDLPVGKRPVGCKWVYTVKYDAHGKIERYKARLVAKEIGRAHV